MQLEELIIIKDNFARELEEGKNGTKNSLSFLVNQLPQNPLVKEGELFQVITLGGTKYRSGLLKSTNKEIELISMEDGDHPIFNTAKDFYSFLESYLKENINFLALNFAQALDPLFENGKLDGTLLAVSKEHAFEGLVGKRVAHEVEDYLLQKKNRKVSISVANDTVCLLLSGLTNHSWDQMACCIVGTGVNSAFFLDNQTVINLESGGFNRIPQSEQALIVDKNSLEPGKKIFEKQVSGAYLYQYFNLTLKEKNINYPAIKTTQQLDQIIAQQTPQVSEIAEKIMKHSAELVATQIAGMAEFLKRDLVFVVEGGLFWNGHNYKKTVEETTKKLTSFDIKFVNIPNSSILGAAKLIS